MAIACSRPYLWLALTHICDAQKVRCGQRAGPAVVRFPLRTGAETAAEGAHGERRGGRRLSGRYCPLAKRVLSSVQCAVCSQAVKTEVEPSSSSFSSTPSLSFSPSFSLSASPSSLSRPRSRLVSFCLVSCLSCLFCSLFVSPLHFSSLAIFLFLLAEHPEYDPGWAVGAIESSIHEVDGSG